MVDHILETRQAIWHAMKDAPAVNSLTPRIYGERVEPNPTWPYIMCGLPTEVSDGASCIDGTRLSVTVHAFARGPAMDACSGLCNAVKRALDRADIPRGDLLIQPNHAQTQIIRDNNEADDYHGIVRFDVWVAEYR